MRVFRRPPVTTPDGMRLGSGHDRATNEGEVMTPVQSREMSSHRVAPAEARALLAGVQFDVESVKQRLVANGGGYEVVHASPGLEIGVYVLLAPEPDPQVPHDHDDDEVYIALDGSGVLVVEGTPIPFELGEAVFVPAGARHYFTAYDRLSMLVIFARRRRIDVGRHRPPIPV